MRAALAPVIVALAAAAAQEPAPPELEAGWECAGSFPQGRLFRLAHANGPLEAVLARGVIDAPAWAVRLVVLTPSRFEGLMPRLAEEVVLAAEQCEPGATELPGCKVQHVYNRIAMPIIQDRDYTLRVELTRDDLEQGGEFEQRWELDEELGPAPRRGITRMLHNRGSWTLTADGERTRYLYSIETDPGGSVPRWMVHRANQGEVRRMLAALEAAARTLAEERRVGLSAAVVP
jgi:hypothetical protein